MDRDDVAVVRLCSQLAHASAAARSDRGVLMSVVDALAGVLPGESHALSRLSPDGARAMVVCSRAAGHMAACTDETTFALEAVAGHDRLAAGEVVFPPDPSTPAARLQRSLLPQSLWSALHGPLRVGEELVGFVSVGRPGVTAFSEGDARTLAEALPILSLAASRAFLMSCADDAEAAFGRALEDIRGPGLVLDALGLRILVANAAMSDLLCVPTDALVGRSWLEFADPEALAALRGMAREARDRGWAEADLSLRAENADVVPCGASLRPLRYNGLDAFEIRITADRPGMASARTPVLCRELSDAVPDVLWVMDADGRYVCVSEALRSITGRDPSEWVGRFPVEGVVLPEDAPVLRRMRESVRLGQPGTGVEWRCPGSEGWMAWFSSSWRPTFDDNGQITGAIGVHRDATATHLAKTQLRRQEEMLRNVVSSIQVGLMSLRPDLTIEWANHYIREAFGPGGEGAHYYRYLLGVTAAPADCAIGRALLTGQVVRSEIVACNGRQYTLVAHPVPNGRGPSGRVVLALTDETERIEARAALQEAERRYRVVADFTHDWEFWLSAEGEAEFHSPSCLQVGGYPASELGTLEAIVSHAATEGDRALLRDHLEAGLAGGSDPEVDFLWRRGDGSEVWLSLAYLGVTTAEGGSLGVRGSIRDVTDRRELAERLSAQRKDAALGSVAGGVAHHFNNLFSIIMGEAQLAEVRQECPPEVREALREIQSAIRLGADHVRRLREYAGEAESVSRPVEALFTSDPEAIAVAAQDLLSQLAPAAEGGSPRIVTEVRNLATRPMRGSHIKICEMLEALLANAVEAVGDEGRVSVLIEDQGDHVVLSVEDDGHGMSDEVQGRAVEPFFTTRGPRRAGLGLSIAFGVVSRAGGRLTISSVEGEGSRVSAHLLAADR